jgi:hypothetical protein
MPFCKFIATYRTGMCVGASKETAVKYEQLQHNIRTVQHGHESIARSNALDETPDRQTI